MDSSQKVSKLDRFHAARAAGLSSSRALSAASSHKGSQSATPRAQQPEGGPMSKIDQIYAIYRKFKPDMVSKVPRILKVMSGNEDQLLSQLQATYPNYAEAFPNSNPVSQMQSHSMEHTKSPELQSMSESAAKIEVEALKVALQQQAEQIAQLKSHTIQPNADAKRRVEAILGAYKPDKLDKIDKLMEQWVGQEEDLIRGLTEKYGPEPHSNPEAVRNSPERQPTEQPVTADIAALENATREALPSENKVAAQPNADAKRRVEAILSAYKPDKLDKIDKLMEQWVGQEEELIKALTQKYGPEKENAQELLMSASAEAQPVADAHRQGESQGARGTSESVEGARQKVEAILAAHKPSKLEKIDELMNQWAGQEDELVKALTEKYGPIAENKSEAEINPSPPTEYVQLPETATHHESPHEVQSPKTSAFMEANSYQDVQTHDDVRQPFFAAVASPRVGTVARDRVKALITKYCPERLHNLDNLMIEWQGREDELIAALVDHFGPEDENWAPLSQDAGMSYRERVIAMFEQYNRERLSSVNNLLHEWQGQEEELIAVLVERHGPEPIRTVSPPRPLWMVKKAAPTRIPSSDHPSPMAAFVVSQLASQRAASQRAASQRAASPSHRDSVGRAWGNGPPRMSSSPRIQEQKRYKDRVIAMYKAYRPREMANASKQLVEWFGMEPELIEHLVQKWGPEPAALHPSPKRNTQSPLRESRGSQFRETRQESQLPEQPVVFKTPENTWGARSTLSIPRGAYSRSSTVASTGLIEDRPSHSESSPGRSSAEPYNSFKAPPAPAAPVDQQQAFETQKRVVAMYAHYHPELISEVDNLLELYAGDEDLILSRLVERWGPEPAETNVAPVLKVLNERVLQKDIAENLKLPLQRSDGVVALVPNENKCQCNRSDCDEPMCVAASTEFYHRRLQEKHDRMSNCKDDEKTLREEKARLEERLAAARRDAADNEKEYTDTLQTAKERLVKAMNNVELNRQKLKADLRLTGTQSEQETEHMSNELVEERRHMMQHITEARKEADKEKALKDEKALHLQRLEHRLKMGEDSIIETMARCEQAASKQMETVREHCKMVNMGTQFPDSSTPEFQAAIFKMQQKITQAQATIRRLDADRSKWRVLQTRLQLNIGQVEKQTYDMPIYHDCSVYNTKNNQLKRNIAALERRVQQLNLEIRLGATEKRIAQQGQPGMTAIAKKSRDSEARDVLNSSNHSVDDMSESELMKHHNTIRVELASQKAMHQAHQEEISNLRRMVTDILALEPIGAHKRRSNSNLHPSKSSNRTHGSTLTSLGSPN